MTKAALNTLLGMGTVFVILILIMLIISMFSWIPKIQAKLSNKNKAGVKERAVDNTIAQIIENEELSDDTELVAVIAAAIAASEGAASTDGFVVRSIKRANTNKWQRA
jgi:sodium pump decarboxylase gamma subunit